MNVVLHFMIIIGIVNSTPLIFDRNYPNCVYNFNTTQLSLVGKLWRISNANFTLQFALCGSGTESHIRYHNSDKTTNLGNRFIAVNSGDLRVETIDGDYCDGKRTIRYKLIVNFVCHNALFEPQLRESPNRCQYLIEMIRPDCRLKCTGLIDDRYLIDLRQFPKNLTVITPEDRRFGLTICGADYRCNIIDDNHLSDVSSCEILNNSIVPLANIDSQSVNYDLKNEKLIVKGRYKSRKITRAIEILIKCNWDEIVANIKFIPVLIQGKRFKFELESSYGCIKLPQKCLLTGKDYLKYDLQKLYRPNNHWLVNNTLNNTIIMLNLCGPLEFDTKNQCSDQYSQICKINNGKYTNLGSLTTFTVKLDIIYVTISNGGRCNDTLNYKTEIQLKCSTIEQSPILIDSINCTTSIVWYTPNACPLKLYQGDNCLVQDPYSLRDLQKLHQPTDKIHQLSSNDRIIYNLCGPLHQNCGNYTNASFCLDRNSRQYVLGWDRRILISDYGQLRLELDGDLCPNQRDYGRVIINCICDYNEQPPKIDIIQDSCKFNLTIYTRLACLSDGHFGKCNATTNLGNFYDLSPLILKNRNYIINDFDDNNVVYSLNLCGPVVANNLALCKGSTMVCMFNRSELDLKQQFKSFGGVVEPQFVNNSLIINTTGDYDPYYDLYQSHIQFECSNRDELPKLLQKTESYLYQFVWRTSYACPIPQCLIPDTNVSLKNLRNTQMEIKRDSFIDRFDLCEDTYQRCNNGDCVEKQLKRTISVQQEQVDVKLDLMKNCSNSTDFHTIIFKILCDNHFVNNEHFENESLQDCILTQILRTDLICGLKIPTRKTTTNRINEEYEYGEIIKENDSRHYYYTTIGNCLINDNNNRPIILNALPGLSRTFSNAKYTLNFNQSINNCRGLFCINDTVVIPFSTNCPLVVNYNDEINLEFSSGAICQDKLIYSVDLVLKCSQESNLKIRKNLNCRIILEYNLPSICYQQEQQNYETTTNTSNIIGGIFGGLVGIVAICLLFYWIRRNYCRNSQYVNVTALRSFYLRDCQD